MRKRNSSGIAVYIRKTIIGGTSFVTTRNKNMLWIKLDKSFFELDKDLYLGTVYISPNTSHRGGSRGRVQGVRTPPPPRDDLRFSNTISILQKKNHVVYWF